jgi:hypothetical protein
MGEIRNAYSILSGELKGKRPLGRHRGRCQSIINMVLQEIICEVVNSIHVAQGKVQYWALVNMITNFWVP